MDEVLASIVVSEPSESTPNQLSSSGKSERDTHILGLWQRSNVPRRHAEKARLLCESSDASDWTDRLARLRGMAGSGFIAVMHGQRGTGKTQFAACLIREYVIRQRAAQYVKAMDLYLTIRETFGGEGMTERGVVESFVRESDYFDGPLALLVIDEAHVRGHSEWEDRLLTHIIDRRYESLLDTLIITNENEAEAVKSLGASIVSRVQECGGMIECNWPSFRA